MAIVKVQEIGGQAYSTSKVTTISTTAGNTIVALVQHQSQTTCTVSDSAGNTYTRATGTSTVSSTVERLGSLWYCLNASAITSLTVTIGATNAIGVDVIELSGVGSFDAANSASVTSGFITVPITVGGSGGNCVLASVLWSAATRAEVISAPMTAMTPSTTSTTFQATGYALNVAAGSFAPAPQWTGISATCGVMAISFNVAVPPAMVFGHALNIG